MIQTILPNQRFLTIPSDNLGKDWFEKTLSLDQQMEALGLEICEEVVYLIYDRSPGAIQAEEGHCLIARPVIGPKKNMISPFGQHDWVQAKVWSGGILINDWDQLLSGCYEFWEGLQRTNKKFASGFMIAIKRTLDPKLDVKGEVLFY